MQNGQMTPQQQQWAQQQVPQQQQQQQMPMPPTPQGWGGNPTGETPTIKFKEITPGTQILGTIKMLTFQDAVYQNKFKGRQILLGVQVDQGPQDKVGKICNVYLTGGKYTDFLSLGINVGDGWGFNYFGEGQTKQGLPMHKLGQLCEKRTNTPPATDPEFGKTDEEYYAAKMGMNQNMQQVMPQNQMTPNTQVPGQSTNIPQQQIGVAVQPTQSQPQQNPPQQQTGIAINPTQSAPAPEIPNFFPQQGMPSQQGMPPQQQQNGGNYNV